MHFGNFDGSCDKSISKHFLDLVINLWPFCGGIILLEILYEIKILYLLEIAHFSIVHHSKLGLICRQESSVYCICVIGTPNPKMFIQEHCERFYWFDNQNIAKVHFPTLPQHWILYILLSNFGSSLHTLDYERQIISDDHIHRAGHIGGFQNPQIVLSFLLPLIVISHKLWKLFFKVIGSHEVGSGAKDALHCICEVVLHDHTRLKGELIDEFITDLLPFLFFKGSNHPYGLSLLQIFYQFDLFVMGVF